MTSSIGTGAEAGRTGSTTATTGARAGRTTARTGAGTRVGVGATLIAMAGALAVLEAGAEECPNQLGV